MAKLNRAQLSQIYRPVGPKYVSTLSFTAGGAANLGTGQIDLSIPIRGVRLVFKGRVVVGTAAFTTVNPEGLLNLIQEIKLLGVNKRQSGNVTLWDASLPTIWTTQHVIERRASAFTINGTQVPIPTTPFPAPGATGYFNGATGTYDFIIAVDLPSSPYDVSAAFIPGFEIRQDEWKDSLQLQLIFGNQLTNAQGALGLAAATTTVTFSAFGSGSGSPTIDVYVLPLLLGLDVKDAVVPGFVTRIDQAIPTAVAANGTGLNLLNLQKQATTRIFVKTGTSLLAPFYQTLSDTLVTAAGVTLGGNRFVRNKVDIFAHKMSQIDDYTTDPIQGYLMFDFVQSNNPDSAYPGDKVGDGATFQVTGDVTTVANAAANILQEQVLYRPEGDLYSF